MTREEHLARKREQSKEYYQRTKSAKKEKQRLYNLTHSEQVRAAAKARKARNADHISRRERDRHLRKKYGITHAQYDAMLHEQSERCAICEIHVSDTPVIRGGKQRLVVDHMHCSGKVRSLLCVQCNSAIGLLGEDTAAMRRAIEYIERHRGSIH